MPASAHPAPRNHTITELALEFDITLPRRPRMNLPGLNFQLGEDIDALRDAVHAFAQAEIAPRAAEADRIFSMLMGDEVAPRREFIESHAKYAKLDV